MYEIRVIENGKESALELASASFPYTFEVGSIAELRDINTSWSYTIDIPRTARNEAIFAHAAVPYVRSTRAYQRMRVNVYSDGLQIIRDGAMFLDSATRSTYKVQIVSGRADVFEAMEAVEYEATENNHTTRLPLYAGEATDDGIAHYADYLNGITNALDGHNLYTEGGQFWQNKLYKFATPLLRIGMPNSGTPGMLPDLMAKIGFSLDTDTSAEVLNGLYVTMRERERTPDSAPTYKSANWQRTYDSGERTHTIEARVPAYDFRYVPYVTYRARIDIMPSGLKNDTISPLRQAQLFFGHGGRILARWTDSVTGEEKHAEITQSEWDGSLPITLDCGLYENGINMSQQILLTMICDTYESRYDTLEIEEAGSTAGYLNAYALADSEEAAQGNTIYLERGSGFANGLELFKTIAQIYGWIVVVDKEQPVIHAKTLQYVIGRKPMAKDWTDKVVRGCEETTYRFGDYARRNTITFADNQRAGTKDVATIEIPNETLNPEASVLDFALVSDSHDSEIYQWQREESDGKVTDTFNGINHAIRDRSGAIEIVSADYVRARYARFAEVLQSIEVLKCQIVLTDEDILNHDPYTPIFLRQSGAYYYVNKIENWESGKIATAELLRI